jgi:hypothetical protein
MLLLVGAIVITSCSGPNAVVTPERAGQAVVSGTSPTLAFQLNAFLLSRPTPHDPFIPLDISLGEMGFTNTDVLKIMRGASLVNATMEIDIPEWDEWLLATIFEIDIPEWDEWLIRCPMEIDIPEWDEWLIRFETMTKYRSSNWVDWAVYGPCPILEIDIPEWDEWLINLKIGDMAMSYDVWYQTN